MSHAASPPLCGCARARLTPGLPVDDALLRIVAIDDHPGWSEIYCRCSGCGRRWRVERDTSYHYPTYQWNDVSQDAVLAARFAGDAAVAYVASMFPAASDAEPAPAASRAEREAEALAALAAHLSARPIGSGCQACGPVDTGGGYEGAALPAALDAALPVLGVLAHQSLRQCAQCGALVSQSWFGPSAADDLLGQETRTVLRRTTLDEVRRLIATERKLSVG